jgi:hypothetical protein
LSKSTFDIWPFNGIKTTSPKVLCLKLIIGSLPIFFYSYFLFERISAILRPAIGFSDIIIVFINSPKIYVILKDKRKSL